MRRISPRHYVLLLSACLLGIGNYYCYDIPGAISDSIQKHLNATDQEWGWQINILYAVYSLPNVFLPLIGGVIIDMLGPTIMLIIFSSCVFVGQLMFSIGLSARRFPLMLAGRLIFGLGGESLEVAQAKVTTDWFHGRYLALALGLNLTFARVATGLNDILSPKIANRFGIDWAGFHGVVFCVVSFASALLMIVMNRKSSRIKAGVHVGVSREFAHVRKESDTPVHSSSNRRDRAPLVISTDAQQDTNTRPYNLRSRSRSPVKRFVSEDTESINSERSASSSPTRSQRASRTNSPIRAIQQQPPSPSVSLHSGPDSIDYDEEDETVHCSQIKSFSPLFWLLCLCTIAMYGSASPFFHICTKFFIDKWYPYESPEVRRETAGFLMAVPDIVSAVLSPVFGYLIDRTGRRGSLLPIAGFILIITHFLLGYTYLPPAIGMSLMGVTYGMFAACLWPCVPYLVKSHQIATGFGVLTIALNISLATIPLLVAKLVPASEDPASHPDWTPVNHFFFGLSILGTCCALLLRYLDSRNGSVLEQSNGHTIETRVSQEGNEETRPLLPSSPRRPPFRTRHNEDEVEETYAETSDGEEDDQMIKVVAEGVHIQVPHTYIHHHHHHHGHNPERLPSPNTLSPLKSPLSKSWSGKSSCDCYSSNGGLENSTRLRALSDDEVVVDGQSSSRNVISGRSQSARSRK